MLSKGNEDKESEKKGVLQFFFTQKLIKWILEGPKNLIHQQFWDEKSRLGPKFLQV